MRTEEQDFSISEALAIARRRSGVTLSVFLAVAVIAAATTIFWPPAYTSKAVILVEPQEIPTDLVRSTVTTAADQRLQQVQARVTATSTLSEIITRLNLYPEERENTPIEVLVEEMRDAIEMEPIREEISDPRTGRSVDALLAFTLSFTHGRPEVAQRVANELVSLYLNENLRTRTEVTQEATTFLSAEAEAIGDEVLRLEERLSVFKEQHANSLPSMSQFNLSQLTRAEQELSAHAQQRNRLEERRVYLASRVAQLEALGPSQSAQSASHDPEIRMLQLRNELISARAAYSASHPDVLRLEREIANLEQVVSPSSIEATLETEVAALESDLVELASRYSPEHPDVKRAERQLDAKRFELQQARSTPGEMAVTSNLLQRDPAYVQLSAELEAVRLEIEALAKADAGLRQRIVEYERRLSAEPETFRQLQNLERELFSAQAKYQELRSKELEARVSAAMETGRKGERFTIIESPLLPEEPSSPNRLLFAAVGLILALGFAGGAGALSELVDDRIHGAAAVAGAVRAPMLVHVPVIESRTDRRRKLLVRLGLLVLVLGLAAAAVALVHFFVAPIETLWFYALRVIGERL